MLKIDKRKARKLYNRGEDVYLLPCKVRPGGMWIEPFLINTRNSEGRNFESLVNEFEFYNCSSETGRSASFYMEERSAVC